MNEKGRYQSSGLFLSCESISEYRDDAGQTV